MTASRPEERSPAPSRALALSGARAPQPPQRVAREPVVPGEFGARQAHRWAPGRARQGDRLHLSAGARLIRGNRLALAHGSRLIGEVFAHPLRSLANVATSAAGIVLRPADTVALVAGAWSRDRADGAILGLNVAATAAGLASVGVMAGAFVLAPLTAGASLVALPLGGILGSLAAAGGLGGLALSLVKNQVDLATAMDAADLDRQARELAFDLVGATFVLGGYGAARLARGAFDGSRLARRANPAALKRVSGRANAAVRHRLGARPPSADDTIMTSTHPGTIKARGAARVALEVARSPLGRRRIARVADMPASRSPLPQPGPRRLAYHGTQEKFAAAIRRDGLRPSEVGDYGHGIYLGNKAEVALNYADDAYLAHPGPGHSVVYTVEMAPGRVMDYLAEKNRFMAWAKHRFDPSDATDPLNAVYRNTRITVSPLVDVRWTRYLNRYMRAKGYDSVRIRNRDALGADYWMIPDPRRIRLLQEIHVPQPTNRTALPRGLEGALVGLSLIGASRPERSAID